LTIRVATAELWAIDAVEQSNALANTRRGSERRERIVVFLYPFFGEEPRIHQKLRFQSKKLDKAHPPSFHCQLGRRSCPAGDFVSRWRRKHYRSQGTRGDLLQEMLQSVSLPANSVAAQKENRKPNEESV
jgi:hypothetical protein